MFQRIFKGGVAPQARLSNQEGYTPHSPYQESTGQSMYATQFDSKPIGTHILSFDKLSRSTNNSVMVPTNNRTTSLNIPGFSHDKQADYTKIIKNYN